MINGIKNPPHLILLCDLIIQLLVIAVSVLPLVCLQNLEQVDGILLTPTAAQQTEQEIMHRTPHDYREVTLFVHIII